MLLELMSHTLRFVMAGCLGCNGARPARDQSFCTFWISEDQENQPFAALLPAKIIPLRSST